MSEDEMLKEHRATFDGFVKLSVYSTVVIVISLALMAIFLL